MQIGDPVVFNTTNRAGSKFRFQTCKSMVFSDGCDDDGCYMVYKDYIRVIDQYNHCLSGRGWGHECEYAPNCDMVMDFKTCTDDPDRSYQFWLSYQIVNMTANFTSINSIGPAWFALATKPFYESDYNFFHTYPWYLWQDGHTIMFDDWYEEQNDGGTMIGTVVT
ncbi:MAG: hypothetical protein GOMPHAMPRED_008203 [Gomphillus americanus]|uniref:Uncharacterized protein n=1 Tax=Gomphillus americanus TaxID=1940652 RepID=A0A8H3IDL5_9LECA|nr:MAG: hypothetical protein GOMPHAMPRED_008203 [Gomphillus americanus]